MGQCLDSIVLRGGRSWSQVRSHPFRAVVTDLDGTLLDPSARITRRAAAAITAARERGILVAAASARPLRLVEDALGEHTSLFDALLVSNGALTIGLPDGAVLDEAVIGAAETATLVDRMRRIWPDAGFGWEVGSHFECDPSFATIAVRRAIVRILDSDPVLGPSTATHQVVVAWPEGDAADRVAEVRDVLTRLAETPVAVTHSEGGVVEVSATGAEKAAAMLRWAGLHGFAADAIVALGDHTNDITMLDAAGFGIAMGNAHLAVATVAAAVTLTNAEEGFAVAIEALLL